MTEPTLAIQGTHRRTRAEWDELLAKAAGIVSYAGPERREEQEIASSLYALAKFIREGGKI